MKKHDEINEDSEMWREHHKEQQEIRTSNRENGPKLLLDFWASRTAMLDIIVLLEQNGLPDCKLVKVKIIPEIYLPVDL